MIAPLLDVPAEVAALVIAMIVGLIALGTFMLLSLHGSRAKLRRRLARAVGSSGQGQIGAKAAKGPKRKSVQAKLKTMDDARARERGYQLRERLHLAGLEIEVWHYLAGCAGAAPALAVFARLAGLGWAGAALLGIIVGIGLPWLVLGILAKRRVGRFTGQMADAIDIVIRGVRSGLPLGECLAIIAREMPDPLGLEFRAIIETQRLGVSLQDALARAVTRMPIPELRYFAIVVAIQQQTGGNLAETLAKLSEVLRSRKRMRDKIQAFASEARTSAYIIGALPIVVILALAALAPHYIGQLFSTSIGNVVLFVGAIIEVSGLLVMRKMINFDI